MDTISTMHTTCAMATHVCWILRPPNLSVFYDQTDTRQLNEPRRMCPLDQCLLLKVPAKRKIGYAKILVGMFRQQ